MRLFTRARPWLRAGSAAALATSVCVTAFAPSSASPVGPQAAAKEPAIAAAEAGLRRLSEVQYARAIEQTFGPGLKIPGRFEPPLREHGLLAIGASHVTVTPSGLEQYELRGRQIAADAVAGGHVEMPCAPKDNTFSASCARDVLGRYGRMLYRRPLTGSELSSLVALAQAGTQTTGSFAKGVSAGLSRLLVSPHFIFRVERDGAAGQIDDWSLATRISFLLWDSPPDEALLDAAARGDLADRTRRAAIIERMIASPWFEQGVRAFFFDMFGYEQFQGLVKDQAIYPKFSNDLVKDAQEQTLRTLMALLIANRGDYRDIFTTRQTFLNRNLAALYRVPAPAAAMDGWAPYTFPANEPRAGILSLAAFLMLDPTHEGKSSPTIRGKTVRELLLCQPVPAPPPNVNFTIVQDDTNPLYQTARQRLLAHQESPACAGCHRVTDPIGLSLENYDATGGYRTHEKTALIDATGTFDGKPYTGLLGLAGLLRESPQVTSCLVQRAFEYALGREARALDADWLKNANARFSAQGNRVPELMRLIASSDAIGATRPMATATAALPPSADQATLTSLYRRAR